MMSTKDKIKFKCSVCGSYMRITNQDTSYDYSKVPKKAYQRTMFLCKKDDVWIRLEIPQTE